MLRVLGYEKEDDYGVRWKLCDTAKQLLSRERHEIDSLQTGVVEP